MLQPAENTQSHSAALKKELGLADLVLTQILYVVGSAWVGTAAKLGSAHTAFWTMAIVLFYLPLALVVIYINRLMPVEGGLYQWAKLGFNPFTGFLVGWNLWLYTIFLVSQLGVILATNLSYALGPAAAWMSANKAFITLITVFVTALLVIVTMLGLSVGKWVQNIGGIAQILTYSALLLIPFLAYRTGALERYHPFAIAAPTLSLFSLNVFGKMSMGAFSGFEYVAILAGECKNPARNITRSIMIATPIIVLMFVLGTDSVLAFVPKEQVDLVGPVPQILSIGFRQIGFAGPIAAIFILLLAARQIGNCTLAMAGCTRLPMVAGWDHLLPRWFSVLHPRYRTPVNSTLFVGAMVLLMGLAGTAGVGHQEAFQLLENASGIFYGLSYVALFALPVFGLRSFGTAPPWLRMAAASGLAVTLLYCVLSIFPIVTVSSWFSFGAKISGVVVGANAVGVLMYLAGSRARKVATSFAILLLATGFGAAQTLGGAIDIHVHSDPDSLPRSLDAIDAAKLAKNRGMRAIVLKNHYEPTASLAYVVRKEVPGIEVFGGIDLNRTVGGINPAAVEHMTRVKGGWGRLVWMPTFDAENQVRYSKENRPSVPVSRNGELLPEVKEVIGLIARHGLVLATGHSSADECLLLLREGRRQGVRHMVVTHAMLAPVRMTVAQMRDATKLGAFVEFVYNALIGPNKMFQIPEYAEAIRQVGPEWCILSSDLGQAGNPLPPDGLERFFSGLREQRFSVEQIDLMSKVNPAKLLGLPLR